MNKTEQHKKAVIEAKADSEPLRIRPEKIKGAITKAFFTH